MSIELIPSTLLAPDCTARDGLLWLLIVRKEASKMDLLEMLAAVEEGKHTRMENVDMVKVRLSNAYTYSYDIVSNLL